MRSVQNLTESLRSSVLLSVNEETYIQDMMNLREEVLIKKGTLYALLPATILGIFANFYPYVFAFLPSHFTQFCICKFYCTSR